jgi:hypothetical protein
MAVGETEEAGESRSGAGEVSLSIALHLLPATLEDLNWANGDQCTECTSLFMKPWKLCVH